MINLAPLKSIHASNSESPQYWGHRPSGGPPLVIQSVRGNPWQPDMAVSSQRSTEWMLNSLRSTRIEVSSKRPYQFVFPINMRTYIPFLQDRLEGIQSLARLAQSKIFMGLLFAMEPADDFSIAVVQIALLALRDRCVAIRRHAMVAIATLGKHPEAVSCMMRLGDPLVDLENMRCNKDEPIGTRRWATAAMEELLK